ncbi:type I-MYXAN CRISPR-associated endonuclease Cas4/Cas1 [Geothrix sp. 21YS21S-4]|uniref:type I-MYXAN CRISPR-associated endonuclease Cas4/Cas1 n=1 Tax=Geothrix sp. 21YS21S-4 TaxID=3068889 RepID=UPI0027B8A140|nr:type I-MYXAN CRISPR-associated endonuclease Cas1 [Geothrix sp. 21YS21S-4]
MAVHAWAYCPRLFYLEEIEEIRVADERIFEGRELHEQLEAKEEGDLHTFTLESETWGLKGKLDACRHRDGRWIVVEHKKGRSRKGERGAEAWESDRLQSAAYGALLAEHLGEPVLEAHIRYHADHKRVVVPVDASLLQELETALREMSLLRNTPERPSVTPHAQRCIHCSLAPVCLPEEERFQQREDWEPLRLYPQHHDRLTLHVLGHGSQLGRSGDQLVVRPLEGPEERFPVEQVEQIVIHGYAQASTQALHLCFARDINVHWLGAGGRYLGGCAAGSGGVQRRIRQYEALRDPAFRLERSKELVRGKVRMQIGFLLRATRGRDRTDHVLRRVKDLRACLAGLSAVSSFDDLRGVEGLAGQAYFGCLDSLLLPELPESLRFLGRSRRPPEDPVNALLSFGYSLLYRDVVAAILAVGLEPAFGLFHTARSAAYPLALDLMELFRVPLVDMVVIASLNRRQWDAERHFRRLGPAIYLNEEGREQAISLFEGRKAETWRHPVLGYSLSYHRLMELEARLLEKSWMGHPGLFARWSLR